MVVVEGVRLVASTKEEASSQKNVTNYFIAAIDDTLNYKGYILPGLGVAGDKIFSTK